MTESLRRVRRVAALALSAAALAVVNPAPTDAGLRAAPSWIAMLDVCLTYFETGERATFKDWLVAFPGGGVCNGDPVCEKPVMTFIGRRALGMGAVIVSVAAPVVGDRPSRAVCESAPTRHRPNEVSAATARWLSEAVDAGRLRKRPGDRGGPEHVGCAYDGREFTLSVETAPIPYFSARLAADAPSRCGALVS